MKCKVSCLKIGDCESQSQENILPGFEFRNDLYLKKEKRRYRIWQSESEF